MRSSVAFALITVNVACWTTVAMADDGTQGSSEKRGKIVATAPRHVDTSHGISTAPERAGATSLASLGGARAGTTERSLRPTVLSTTATLVGSGVNAVTATVGNVANVMRNGTHVYPASKTSPNTTATVIGLSAAGVSLTPTFRETAGVAVRTDRTGEVASFGGAQTNTVKPMGAGVAMVNLTSVNVQPEPSPKSVVASVGVVLSSSAGGSLTLGSGLANAKASVLADAPSGSGVAQKPDAFTSRSVGVWNSASSMNAAIQHPPRIRHR